MTLQDRDAEYRRALGLKPGEPIPRTLGFARGGGRPKKSSGAPRVVSGQPNPTTSRAEAREIAFDRRWRACATCGGTSPKYTAPFAANPCVCGRNRYGNGD